MLALAAAASCGGSDPSAQVNTYELKGIIQELDSEHQTALIRHQEIKDWMHAMTMEFPVQDAREFSALRKGETIRATVYHDPIAAKYWIGNVVEIDENLFPEAPAATAPAPDEGPAASERPAGQ